ncbi:MAG: CBS domain-containing protein [Candidatus Lokiarchaeota archaeon]|nr:CBS domain-containing protein [Candidatus Lokiarchaeota archaeon]
MQPPDSKCRFSIPTGKDLYLLRLERGLSQAELARIAGEGFSQSLIARIENGTVNPPLSKVRRLLEVLYEDTSGVVVTAKQIAVKLVLIASHADSVAIVIEKMNKKGVSQLPVQGIDERLIGSITEKKLAEEIMTLGKDVLKLPVSTIMEAPLPEIDASESITEIQQQLLNAPAIIVKDGEKVSGILTKTDLLRHFGTLEK